MRSTSQLRHGRLTRLLGQRDSSPQDACAGHIPSGAGRETLPLPFSEGKCTTTGCNSSNNKCKLLTKWPNLPPFRGKRFFKVSVTMSQEHLKINLNCKIRCDHNGGGQALRSRKSVPASPLASIPLQTLPITRL